MNKVEPSWSNVAISHLSEQLSTQATCEPHVNYSCMWICIASNPLGYVFEGVWEASQDLQQVTINLIIGINLFTTLYCHPNPCFPLVGHIVAP